MAPSSPASRDRGRVRVVLVEPSNAGGVFDYTMLLAGALAESGADVAVAAGARVARLRFPAGVACWPCFQQLSAGVLRARWQKAPRRVINGVLLCWGLLRVALRCAVARPSVVHLQGASDCPPAYATLALVLRLVGIQIVYTPHNAGGRKGMPLQGLAMRVIVRLANATIVHSGAAEARWRRLAPRSDGKLHVVPLGEYRSLLEPADPDRGVTPGHVLHPPGARVLLFFGFIRPYKGLDLLLKAFARVVEQYPDTYLSIVGEPREPFDRYAALIDRLGLGTRVTTRLAFVSQQELACCLETCDLVVCPYRAEPEIDASGVLQVALGAGRPVVVTNVGGLAEYIRDGVTGFIARPEDVDDLAAVLRRALSLSDGRLREMGIAAQETSLAVHSWREVSARTLDVYRRVLGATTAMA